MAKTVPEEGARRKAPLYQIFSHVEAEDLARLSCASSKLRIGSENFAQLQVKQRVASTRWRYSYRKISVGDRVLRRGRVPSRR